MFRCVDTTAPLAGENTGGANAIGAELLADALSLSASSSRQIALCAAIFQLEAGGSPVPGAIACRRSATCPPDRSARQSAASSATP